MRQLTILVLVLCLFLIRPLSAQDQAGEQGADAAGEASAAGADAVADPSEEEGDDDSPAYADDLNDFIPSSEVPPDEQLTFPVDI